MRVLIIRNAYAQDAGGAEQYALNLAIALKMAGHRPILVTKVQKIHEKARKGSIKIISGPWHSSQKWDRWYYLRYPIFTLWYVWIIIRYRIDIVHPQSRDDFVFATRAAKLLGRKVVWTDHADLKYVLDNVNHYNPRMRSWVIKASKSAFAITVPSNSEEGSIRQVATELNNLIVIHNGVFVPHNIKPATKTNELVVGTNARLVPSKGIDELMEAFAALKSKEADLWLLGGISGNKVKYEKLATKLNINTRVKFLDYVPDPNNYVASMDVFIHASYHEAFSLAIIEAAMLGRPIIATNVGGTPEIIDKNCGVLIIPKSSDAIAGPLRQLINDRQLRTRLGMAAQKKAKRDFDFQRIVEDEIIPLYNKLNEKK